MHCTELHTERKVTEDKLKGTSDENVLTYVTRGRGQYVVIISQP